MKTDPNHGERISAIETEVRSLTRNVSELAEVIRSSHQETQTELKQLANQLYDAPKQHRPMYFAVGTIVIALFTAMISPIWLRLGAVEIEMNSTKVLLAEHRILPVHPVAAKQLEYIEKRLEMLERNRVEPLKP